MGGATSVCGPGESAPPPRRLGFMAGSGGVSALPRFGVELVPERRCWPGPFGRPTSGIELVDETKVGSLIMFLLTVMRRRLPPGVTRPESALGVVRPLVGKLEDDA